MVWLVALVSAMVGGMLGLLGFAYRHIRMVGRDAMKIARRAGAEAARHGEGAAKTAAELQSIAVEVGRLKREVSIAYWTMKASAWMSEAGFFKQEDHPLRAHYYRLAEEALSAALELDSRNGTARIWLAWLRKRSGAVEEALDLVEGALDDPSLHNHERARGLYNASCYCAILSPGSSGKRARAIEYLRSAVEGAEIFRELAREDPDFNALRGYKGFDEIISE